MQEIEQDLGCLIADLPVLETPYREDVFSISGFPHWETVMSNWFAYFLDCKQSHGFSGLFAESFKELILQKNGDVGLDWLNDSISSLKERFTKKGNYIDLVVYDISHEDDNHFENALIIEHKIGADLYNDLADYYRSIKTEDEKVGVVLSAKSIDVTNKHYVNITYADLVLALNRNLGKYVARADLTSLAYLKDFMNNLERMSENMNTEALEFCLKNGGAIKRIADVKNQAESDLVSIIRNALADTDYNYNRKYSGSFSVRTKDDRVVLIFSTSDLFSEKKMPFQYWLHQDGVKQWNAVTDISELITRYGEEFSIRDKKQGKDWVEVVRGSIHFNESNLHETFEAQLLDYLKERVDPLTEFLFELMEQQK